MGRRGQPRRKAPARRRPPAAKGAAKGAARGAGEGGGAKPALERPVDFSCWLRDFKSVDAVLPERPRRGVAHTLTDRRLRVAFADPLPPRGRRRGKPTGEPVLYHPHIHLATIEKGLVAASIAPAHLIRGALCAAVHGAPLLLDDEKAMEELGPLIAWSRPLGDTPAGADSLVPLLRAGAAAVRTSLGHADLAYEACQQLAAGKARKGAVLGTLERFIEVRKRDATRDGKRRFERHPAGAIAYYDLLPLLVKQLDDDLGRALGGPFGVMALAVGVAIVPAKPRPGRRV